MRMIGKVKLEKTSPVRIKLIIGGHSMIPLWRFIKVFYTHTQTRILKMCAIKEYLHTE